MSSLKSLIRLTLSCAACIAASAAPAVAAPSWVAPFDITHGQNAYSQTVGVDAHGDAIAVSAVDNGSGQDLQASFRPAGGAWQAPVTLATTPTAYFVSPQVAFDRQGDAAVVWSLDEGSGWRAKIAVRLASTGTWRAAADICQPNQQCAYPRIAVGDQGNAVAVWEIDNGADWVIDGAAGSIVSGTWQQPGQLSANGASAYAPRVGLDAQGDATALWYRYSGNVAIIQSATHAAQGGAWSAAEPVSAPGLDTSAPQLAVDPSGDAVAVWESYNGKFTAIDTAARVGQGGAWSPPGPVTAYGFNASDPEVATDSTGHATAIWRRSDGSNWIIEAADLIDLHGSWSAAHQLSPAGVNASDPRIAVDQHGDRFAAWQLDVTVSSLAVQGAARPAGASWPAAHTLSGDGENAESPAVGADENGDAIAVWTRMEMPGNTHTQRAAIFDATPPSLSAVSIPTAGTAGQPVSFSASPTDMWSAVGTTWDFGDGGGATGTSLAHTYAKAGTYTVTVTITDAAGFTAHSSGTITVAPAPTHAVQAGHKPRISAAMFVPGSFRPARSAATVSARGRLGSVLRFTLSTAASLQIVITRTTIGRHHRVRTIRIGVVRRTRLAAGEDRIAFTGRLGRRVLRAGRYRATLTARNANGTSAAIVLRFRIVR